MTVIQPSTHDQDKKMINGIFSLHNYKRFQSSSSYEHRRGIVMYLEF